VIILFKVVWVNLFSVFCWAFCFIVDLTEDDGQLSQGNTDGGIDYRFGSMDIYLMGG
jgi:hypothetical protein